ncbi:hypothetical protein ACMFMG_009271 [Clarireedia jacksonii]
MSPAPVPTPRRISHQEPQEVIKSWSTAASRLSKSEDNAAIRAIFGQPVQEVDVNGESGKDGPEEEVKREVETNEQNEVKPMRSSSTLNAVKIRLKKTFSRDSGLAKRSVKRGSVGTSEEELERRKELRRLRQKRIEEELSHEGEYDDDAQSLSTVDCAGESCVKSRRKRQSILPEDSGNFPVFRRRTPQSTTTSSGDDRSKISLSTSKIDDSKMSLSTLKIEDTSKISVPDLTNHSKSRSDAPLTELTTVLLKPSTSPPRRYSSPGPPPLDLDLTSFDVNQSRRQLSVIPTLPKTPIIEAQRLPSICIPDPKSSSSWRLSYSSNNRGHHLRKLSQQFETPSTAIDLTAVGTQPLARWLKSHGPRSLSQVIAPSEASTHAEPIFPPSRRSESGFGGVDGSGSDIPVVHLQDMDIHRRLLQSSCSSPQLSSLTRELSGISQIRARRMPNTSDSIPLSELVPPTWGMVIADGTSSFYPSVVNSIQPSPNCSKLELSCIPTSKSHLDKIETEGMRYSMFGHGMDMLTFAVTEEVITPLLSPTILDTPTTINVSTTSLNAPLSRYSARQIDESSLFASETTSFRERELELSQIQARFASSEARRSPSTPISSKFREEFNLPVSVQPSRSPFQKLVRLASIKRRSEDTDTDDMLLAPPAHRMGFGYRFSTTPLNFAGKGPIDATPTKGLQESVTTPVEGDSDIMETPVKTRFSALQRIRRLASMGGFDGALDEPEEMPSSTGQRSRGSGNFAPGNLVIPASRSGSESSGGGDQRGRKKSALDNRLGLTSTMASQSADEKMQPSRQTSPNLSKRPTRIGIPTPSGSFRHSPTAAPVIEEHQGHHHLSIPHPHMLHPHMPHPSLNISMNNLVHHSPGHAKKELKAALAVALAVSPAKNKHLNSSESPQPSTQSPQPSTFGQQPVSEPPKWRGPRAKNRVPSRDRIDTSHDDSAAVWMKAVKGAVANKSRVRKTQQDEDDIFGDWEAELAGVSSRAKYESRLFSSRGKPKIRQIEQFPPAWCRFPSHEREARGAESAGKNEQVETKDFALPNRDAMGKTEHAYGARRRRPGATMSDNIDTSDELDPILTADTWHKRLSQRVKDAWMDYWIEQGHKKHAFHSGSLGRRGSMTLDGKVQYPELELLPMRVPPPPSEVVDEEADDLEAERKRVEEIQKTKIKPHYEAMDLSKSKGGVGDLLEIFSQGPEEPQDPQIPVKKKGTMARKKVEDPYALDDDDDDDLLSLEEKDKMPIKKKEKARDPYDIDFKMNESSYQGDEVEDRKIGEISISEPVEKRGHVAEKSLIGNVDPDFHAECLIPEVQAPKKVHVRELSGLGSRIDENVIEEEEEGEEVKLDERQRSRGRDSPMERDSSKTSPEKSRVKTWNGKDWEREMGIWKRRDTSVGRDSIGNRSIRSFGAESIGSGISRISKLSRETVKSVVKEVQRLEDLERERKEMMKNGGNLTDGVRSRSVSLRSRERREQLRKSSMASGLEGEEPGELDLGMGEVAVRGRRMTFGE